MKLTFAFCTYNRADRLENLVAKMREQACPVPFEILAVNNNSQDDTLVRLQDLASRPGVSMRFVTEDKQGIVHARNRAIAESIDSDMLVFIDDDEAPCHGMLSAVCDAILNEGAECVGGRISVDFSQFGRPSWLDDELSGFLGALDYGDQSIWITRDTTPLWSGNIAYDMKLFRADSALRFDQRFNREGADMGGGEDLHMFRTLLAKNVRMRYRPDMAITHSVEQWRLKRGYFLKLHYSAGVRNGRYNLPEYVGSIWGVPPFMTKQLLIQGLRFFKMQLMGKPGAIRQGMNATNAFGMIIGLHQRWKDSRQN